MFEFYDDNFEVNFFHKKPGLGIRSFDFQAMKLFYSVDNPPGAYKQYGLKVSMGD